MKSLSNLAYNIEGQPMFKILDMANQLEREGMNILHFELGEPDFDTPKNIVDAACDSLYKGETHYTSSMGLYDFRLAVQDTTLISRGFRPDLDQILVAPGANSIIYLAIKCLVNPGEEVIAPDPGFPTYFSAIKACGAKAVSVVLKESNNFKLNPIDLEKAITDKTRLIILNSPSNPTGAVMSAEEINQIAQIAKEKDIFLLSDEVYARLIFNDKKQFASPSSLDQCKERTIVLNGFSKAFAMTGWRLGVAIGPKEVIEKMGLLVSTIVSCVSPFTQRAGIEAIKGNQQVLLDMKKEYSHRANVLVEGLNQIDGISCVKPEGAIYAFANISKTGMSSEEFATFALKEAGVALLPGIYFGKGGEGYVRICYVNSLDNIKTALYNLKNAIEKRKLHSTTSKNKMRVVDYVAQYIYNDMKVDNVFMITGGGAMFLNDGIASHPYLKAICNHHEQACTMGALAYSKYSNKIGVAIVTTGCGGTNAITGLLDAWQDNTPILVISGQAKRKETSHNVNVPLRQFGVQEADIIPIVRSITKYSTIVNDPNDIAYHLEKAIFLSTHGRPGPVWIDIPLDVQGSTIDINNLKHFNYNDIKDDIVLNDDDIKELVQDISKAQRPIVIAGNGIRLSNTLDKFHIFLNKSNLPIAVSYLGVDLISTSDKKHIGRLGTKGDRAGNFAVANADLILVLGCRLSVALTGFEYKMFGREAKIIVVDIDKFEHQKNTVRIDKFIHADLRNFFDIINKCNLNFNTTKWLEKCNEWKAKWPVALKKYEMEDKINKYTFIDHLCKYLKKDACIVSDAGSAYYVTSQTLRIENDQRYITSGAQADMGFTIPACIGASIAKSGEVVGITGDGSFQMNIQELQTIVHNQLPIKLFVWNNNGYLSIRATQNKFFEARAIGTDKDSGVSFPDIYKIANAYGIAYYKAIKIEELDSVLQDVINFDGPVICEIICPENQEIVPASSSKKLNDGTMVSSPLEDMYPFLDRKELKHEMIIKLIDNDSGGGKNNTLNNHLKNHFVYTKVLASSLLYQRVA